MPTTPRHTTTIPNTTTARQHTMYAAHHTAHTVQQRSMGVNAMPTPRSGPDYNQYTAATHQCINVLGSTSNRAWATSTAGPRLETDNRIRRKWGPTKAKHSNTATTFHIPRPRQAACQQPPLPLRCPTTIPLPPSACNRSRRAQMWVGTTAKPDQDHSIIHSIVHPAATPSATLYSQATVSGGVQKGNIRSLSLCVCVCVCMRARPLSWGVLLFAINGKSADACMCTFDCDPAPSVSLTFSPRFALARSILLTQQNSGSRPLPTASVGRSKKEMSSLSWGAAGP